MPARAVLYSSWLAPRGRGLGHRGQVACPSNWQPPRASEVARRAVVVHFRRTVYDQEWLTGGKGRQRVLLTVRGLQKHFGPEPVFDGVDLTLRAGEHRALVGPNGAGKTTLLRVLLGQEAADRGTVEWAPRLRVAALEQHAQFAPAETVWDAARSGLADLLALAEEAEHVALELASATVADHQRLTDRLDRLHAELAHRDGYQVEHRIERVLQGVGFRREQFAQPAATLSGGQQHRVLLARLLLAEPDVLILDEPTNHLDLEATAWLEDYLRGLSQALIVVSHDRYFLDRVAGGVWELVDGQLAAFDGGWTAYLKQRAERVALQRQAYERWQAEAARLQEFIRRNQAGQKSTQAADRQKKLERLVPVAKPREISVPVLGFPPAERTGDLVLRCRNLSKAWPLAADHGQRADGQADPANRGIVTTGQRVLFKQLNWQVERGERWAILGPNGAGKTTLLSCLTGRVHPDCGEVQWGAGVKLGCLTQSLDPADARLSAIDAVWPKDPDWTIGRSRDLLGRFGISGDLAEQTLGQLSGGERTRVLLARLAAAEANVLLLDEPTNHLDVWTRQALEEQLLQWNGTLLIVSHDRYFIDRLATHVLSLEGGPYRLVAGGYQAFIGHTLSGGVAGGRSEDHRAVGAESRGASSESHGKAVAPPAPGRRKRKFPYRKVGDLEAEILDRESEVEHLSSQLLDPAVLRDGRRVRELQAVTAAARERLAELYAHYDEALELNGEAR